MDKPKTNPSPPLAEPSSEGITGAASPSTASSASPATVAPKMEPIIPPPTITTPLANNPGRPIGGIKEDAYNPALIPEVKPTPPPIASGAARPARAINVL